MKKILFLFLTAFALITTQAQVRFGVKAGANFATLTGSDVSGAKMKVDFHFGGFAHIPLTSMFSFHPELLYSGQGAKFDGGKDNLSYLNIPVLFQYNNPSGFYVETGPQVGFILSAKEKVDGGSSVDIKDQVKSTDFAWALGLGFVTQANVGFGVRYNAGLSNIADGGGKIQNGVFQLSVHYWFGSSEGSGKKSK